MTGVCPDVCVRVEIQRHLMSLLGRGEGEDMRTDVLLMKQNSYRKGGTDKRL